MCCHSGFYSMTSYKVVIIMHYIYFLIFSCFISTNSVLYRNKNKKIKKKKKFNLKPALSLSSFTLIKKLLSSSSLFSIRVGSSAHLRLLMCLLPILILACNSSTPVFLMMCSVYRLNKQGDSKQLCHTPFSILNQSVAPYQMTGAFI